MKHLTDSEQPPGDRIDISVAAADALRDLPYLVPANLVAPLATSRGWRRWASTGLAVLGSLAVAGGLFVGGWWAHVALREGASTSSTSEELAAVLFPDEGVTLEVRWGDLPRRLVEEGVIDVEKFKAAAERAGAPLTLAQLALLTEGSGERVHIDAQNAYFVLDVLWALGLSNSNRLLTEGPLAQYGRDRAGGLAGTGGWTIGVNPGSQYLAALELLPLTPEQQTVVDEVAYESYRPCCENMTAFPDCNHGMAALALTELMASQGAKADEIFAALKQISPLWFPNQYHHLALYFEMQDQEWEEVDARLVMGQTYSSAGGWRQVNAWLRQQGAIPGAGGEQGGASGCAP